MAVDDIRADIAFVKDLVDDSGGGRRGGILMTVSGLVFAITSVIVWWTANTTHWPTGWWIAGIWFAASVVDYVICVALTARLPRGANVSSRALRSVGVAIGFTMMALFCAGIFATLLTHSGLVWLLFPSIVLATYGSFWFVSAAVTREAWRNAVAVGCYIAATVAGPLMTRGEGSLFFAACLTLFATIPGIVMLRAKRG